MKIKNRKSNWENREAYEKALFSHLFMVTREHSTNGTNNKLHTFDSAGSPSCALRLSNTQIPIKHGIVEALIGRFLAVVRTIKFRNDLNMSGYFGPLEKWFWCTFVSFAKHYFRAPPQILLSNRSTSANVHFYITISMHDPWSVEKSVAVFVIASTEISTPHKKKTEAQPLCSVTHLLTKNPNEMFLRCFSIRDQARPPSDDVKKMNDTHREKRRRKTVNKRPNDENGTQPLRAKIFRNIFFSFFFLFNLIDERNGWI